MTTPMPKYRASSAKSSSSRKSPSPSPPKGTSPPPPSTSSSAPSSKVTTLLPLLSEDLASIYYQDNSYYISPLADTALTMESPNRLEHLTTFQFDCACETPHCYFFILPLKEAVKYSLSQTRNCLNPFSKLHDKVSYLKWTVEDREFLKRLILQYGYGRWNKINEQSVQSNGKLHLRGKGELRSFSNAFVRSVAELIQH